MDTKEEQIVPSITQKKSENNYDEEEQVVADIPLDEINQANQIKNEACSNKNTVTISSDTNDAKTMSNNSTVEIKIKLEADVKAKQEIDIKPDSIHEEHASSIKIESMNTKTDIKLKDTKDNVKLEVKDNNSESSTDNKISIKKNENVLEERVGTSTDDVEMEAAGGSQEDLTDELHYTKTGVFTSEMFKVIVNYIPANIRYGRFREHIRKVLGFHPKKVKYNPNTNYAFVACSNEEERQKAISILDGLQWKNNTLECKPAAPARDPFVESQNNKRRQREDGNDSSKWKKPKLHEDDSRPAEERIVDVVCPYAKYTYEEQIKMKNEAMFSVTTNFARIVKKEDLFECWRDKERNNVCLELHPVVESPILTNYRNKVEFTIGTGPDDKDNTVGFRLGSYKVGSMLIVEAKNCINVSKVAVDIAKEFQDFIQTLPHASYNLATHKGLWQQLIVRTFTTGETMVIIQISMCHLREEELKTLEHQIFKMYTYQDEAQPTNVTSVYFSWSSLHNSNIDKFQKIAGNSHIYENLLGCKFRISPDAFFQVNTPTAEILYNKVFEWCDTEQPDACILDVCCGTGTIGISIASKTSLPVYGIEINEQAIEDANYNAEINNIKNAKFFCGPAERILSAQINKIKQQNIIAVVDPPRAGLHKTVIGVLRSCKSIKKIIYVSCSPKQAVDNFLSLCRPRSKRRHGLPFQTTRAVPVDLFPQTPHCELIVELTRQGTIEQNNVKDNSAKNTVPVDITVNTDEPAKNNLPANTVVDLENVKGDVSSVVPNDKSTEVKPEETA